MEVTQFVGIGRALQGHLETRWYVSPVSSPIMVGTDGGRVRIWARASPAQRSKSVSGEWRSRIVLHHLLAGVNRTSYSHKCGHN